MPNYDLEQALLAARERLALAEAALDRVLDVGHNDDCRFCGLKDRQVAVYEETLERRGLP